MKKLMIAAAVAVLGIAANAASFSWSSTANMVTGPGSTTVATEMNPVGSLALVYLGTTESWSWENATVVQRGTPDFGVSMGKPVAQTAVSFSFSMDDYGNNDVFGVVFESSDKTLYYIQNADGNIDKTYAISGLDNDKSQLAAFNFATSAHWLTTDSSAAVNVPEPTSGLLLLLGVAGLALKRRRA